MKKKLSVAKRYAKALLILGKEDGCAEQYGNELSQCSKTLSDSVLESVLANPLYVAGERKNVLIKILNKFELSKALQSFLLLLFDKGRIGLMVSINEYYQMLLDEVRGISRASIVSAADLSSEAIEKIRKALSKLTGKEVKLDVRTNPDLIGGIVTRIGDLVLDGSIKTQLLSMKESLKRGESI